MIAKFPCGMKVQFCVNNRNVSEGISNLFNRYVDTCIGSISLLLLSRVSLGGFVADWLAVCISVGCECFVYGQEIIKFLVCILI